LPVILFSCIFTSPVVGGAGPNNSKQQPDPIRVAFVTEDNFVIVGGYTPPKGADKDKIAAEVKEASGSLDDSSKTLTPEKRAALFGKTEPKAPIVILLHMYQHDSSSYDPLIPFLHEAGFACLAIDLRGHGDSVGPKALHLAEKVDRKDKNLFAKMDRDVTAAFSWIVQQKEVDPTRVGLIGASVGCSVALDYARNDASVDAVICMTPGTDYLGIDSVKHVKEYGRRDLLLLAGEDEQKAAKELGKIVPAAKLKIFDNPSPPQAIHGTRMFGKVPGVEKLIVDFLKNAFGPAPPRPVVASINSNVFHLPSSGTAQRIHPDNRRWFSTPAEAHRRGLRPPRR
jgi:dienelactone hydrolase